MCFRFKCNVCKEKTRNTYECTFCDYLVCSKCWVHTTCMCTECFKFLNHKRK